MGIDELSLESFFEFLKRTYPAYLEGCDGRICGIVKGSVRVVTYKAGRRLLELGDNEKMTRLLLRGLGVGIDASGTIRALVRPGEFMMDFSSFISGEPSRWDLQSYTSIRVAEIPRDVEESLLAAYPAIYGLVTARVTHIRMVESSWREILESSHSDRYGRFLHRYPGISQVMRVKDLASLLGYKYDTLKRIRQAESEREKARRELEGKRTRVSYSTGCY